METIDLNFLGKPEVIASYVFHGNGEVAIVESGPGSTVPTLKAGLEKMGLAPSDVTHVLVTHIHLDHAGAAGWLAQHGAKVYVHPKGARHLIDPSRLWASATRLYGEDGMKTLWGEMLPIPEEQVIPLTDGYRFEAAGQTFTALDTPGHANHHIVYLTDEGDCFTGDVGGCRLPGFDHIRIPTMPPEFNQEAWLNTLERIIEAKPKRLHLTHYGTIHNASDHLQRLVDGFPELAAFMEELWQKGCDRDETLAKFSAWIREKSLAEGVDEEALERYEMSSGDVGAVEGFRRYQKKRDEKKAEEAKQ